MTPTDRELKKLLRLLEVTEPEELDCDQFLQLAAALLETLETGQPQPPELAAASQHLAVCPECSEEFQALLRAYDVG